MSNKSEKIVIYSGYVVLSAVVIILFSTAFLRGGHPPGSGIVNLGVLVLVYPLSVYSSVVGLKANAQSIATSPKLFYTMTGVCLSFVVFSTLLFVIKFIFGGSI
jgi:hypothetical protein